MRTLFGIPLFILGLVLAAAQAGEDKGVTLSNVDEKGKERNEAAAKLKKGEILTVKMSGNPTTGYSWFVDKNDKDALAPQGKIEYQSAAKGKIVGAGGTFIARFKAENAGSSNLEFVYKRPFEKDKAPIKTFKIKVEVE